MRPYAKENSAAPLCNLLDNKDNPDEAIKRIATLKEDSSEYVRKSVGNALRDISKKFPDLIKEELDSWDVKSKEIQKVYKLASKFIK